MQALTILDQPRFALASLLANRLADEANADLDTRKAVAVLTGSAAPERAERLAPRAGEPAVLVERLAMWALPRADDEAVAVATALLAGNARPRRPRRVRVPQMADLAQPAAPVCA